MNVVLCNDCGLTMSVRTPACLKCNSDKLTHHELHCTSDTHMFHTRVRDIESSYKGKNSAQRTTLVNGALILAIIIAGVVAYDMSSDGQVREQAKGALASLGITY